MFEGIYSWMDQVLVFHFCVVYTISSIFLYSLSKLDVFHCPDRALGHAANRGKVYYLHPELFKVCSLSLKKSVRTRVATTYPLFCSLSMLVMGMTKHGSTRTNTCRSMAERYSMEGGSWTAIRRGLNLSSVVSVEYTRRPKVWMGQANSGELLFQTDCYTLPCDGFQLHLC